MDVEERILLQPGNSTGVFESGSKRITLPLAFLPSKDPLEEALRSIREDVILLVEGSALAHVRVGGVWISNVPLFREDSGRPLRVGSPKGVQ